MLAVVEYHWYKDVSGSLWVSMEKHHATNYYKYLGYGPQCSVYDWILTS